MPKVNPVNSTDKPKIATKKKSDLAKAADLCSEKRVHKRNSEQSVGEIFKLLGEATYMIPLALTLGAGKLLKSYLSEYKEAGAALYQVTADSIKYTSNKISLLKQRFTKKKEPEETKDEQSPLPPDSVDKKTDTKPPSSSSESSVIIKITQKESPKSKPKRQVGFQENHEPVILTVDLLKLKDADLTKELIIRLDSINQENPNSSLGKAIALLESTLMGVPFEDLSGMFNTSKNYLIKEELVQCAKDELIVIFQKYSQNIDLAKQIVERISKLNAKEENDFSEVIKMSSFRARAIAERFKDLPGINKFLGISPDAVIDDYELTKRESYLVDSQDIGMQISYAGSQYKDYLRYLELKKSDNNDYAFNLGRIDQILRESGSKALNKYSIRRQFAEMLKSSQNADNDGKIVSFALKAAELDLCGVSGAENLINKAFANREKLIDGHLVEANIACTLFNELKKSYSLKSFNMEASKNYHDCDIDVLLKTVDFTDAKQTYFVEIKSSIGFVNLTSDQREKLLNNLPEGAKLIYIVDGLTEGFINNIVNYNEVARLKEVISNNKIEIWLSNGKNVTGLIKKTLGLKAA